MIDKIGGRSMVAVLAWLTFFVILNPLKGAYTYTESDVDALIALKESLHDRLGLLSNWNRGTNPCKWTGVYCNDRRVTKLTLEGMNLRGGQLVWQIGEFKSLQYLNMSKTGITENIPPEIGDLTDLVTLDLSHNQLSGLIPSEIRKLLNLTTLLLNDNDLSGCEPVDAFTNLFTNGKLNYKNLNLANNPNLLTRAYNSNIC
ncbi:Leucine-rich repeat (LRR) family protein [Striga hermonthica]|uniref:Leucine-rich repeat (LRR) family protein n=1 Tax=Striga hermonthica TaxID=68872 RepID=A0A9N7RB07_STRHE|nr:Leucine-rich repeat (LRR) family protein [Striga hermonthica]